ncbi:MAG: GntR family transcriptional regulator, partial [Candidatus Dormibacteraceae bacterium]
MRPKYRQIADDLRAAISSGELAEGAQLPSINVLMKRYGASDRTVRTALDELKTSGLIVSKQGKPAVVRVFHAIRRSSPARLTREQWGTGRAIQDADTEVRSRVVDVVVAEGPAPEWAAEPLGLTPGATALSRDRRFLVDDRPVQLATSYFDAELV